MKDTLDGEESMAVLGRLADALGKDGPPVRLCLIDSADCLFGGMHGRSSRDGICRVRPKQLTIEQLTVVGGTGWNLQGQT